MTNAIFKSHGSFHELFESGLKGLLRPEGGDPNLGSWVLACANAYFEPALHARLHPLLEETLDRFRAGRGGFFDLILRASDDDVHVFRKIAAVGLANLPLAEFKPRGNWVVQSNMIRSLRPQRAAQATVESIRVERKPTDFTFNKPGLEKECFWSGTCADRYTSLYFNKFPFAHYHALVFPDLKDDRIQFLEKADHDWAWQFAKDCEQLPGFGLGYNSIGAFASVNHLHFQFVLEPDGLPVTSPVWAHNEGSECYPSACVAFDSSEDAWKWLSIAHICGVAYNLLFTPGKLFCFPRKRQGTYTHAQWTSGFAFFELSGGIIVSDSGNHNGLTVDAIKSEFAKLCP